MTKNSLEEGSLSGSIRLRESPTRTSGARTSAFWQLLQHRRLIGQLVRRDIEGRYRGSILGLAWAMVQPLSLLAVYTFVFGIVFRPRWPGLTSGNAGEFAMVLFCGLIALNLFNECVGRAPTLVLSHPNYVKKVVFPLEVLPVVSAGTALFHAAVSMLVLAVANAVGGTLHWTILLCPLVIAPLVMLILGTSWFLASLGVFVRDLSQALQLMLQALMFLSPVFYPVEALPENFRPLIRLNPLTPVVEGLRGVTLWGQLPDWAALAVAFVVDGTVMLLGYAWFIRTKHAFADVV